MSGLLFFTDIFQRKYSLCFTVELGKCGSLQSSDSSFLESSKFFKLITKRDQLRKLDPSSFLKRYKTWAARLQLVACLFIISVDEDAVVGSVFQEIILLVTYNCHLASADLVEDTKNAAEDIAHSSKYKYCCFFAGHDTIILLTWLRWLLLPYRKNDHVFVWVFCFVQSELVLSFAPTRSFAFSVTPKETCRSWMCVAAPKQLAFHKGSHWIHITKQVGGVLEAAVTSHTSPVGFAIAYVQPSSGPFPSQGKSLKPLWTWQLHMMFLDVDAAWLENHKGFLVFHFLSTSCSSCSRCLPSAAHANQRILWNSYERELSVSGEHFAVGRTAGCGLNWRAGRVNTTYCEFSAFPRSTSARFLVLRCISFQSSFAFHSFGKSGDSAGIPGDGLCVGGNKLRVTFGYFGSKWLF